MAVIGGRNVGNNDLVIMGAGVLMFIDSFLPWWGASVSGFASVSYSGWHFAGAWLPVLLVMAVAGVTAARVFGGVQLPRIGNGAVSWAFAAAAVSLIAFVVILLRWVTYPGVPSGASAALLGAHIHASAGAKFGTYIGLIVAAVQTVFGYLSITAAGEKLPWQQRTA